MNNQIKKNVEVTIDHNFNGNYRALVEDDRDPNDWGRVKVRVIGVHSEFSESESGSDAEVEFLNAVPTKDLPWATMAIGLTRSGGENVIWKHRNAEAIKKGMTETGTGGDFVIPKPGSHVWVFFHNGHHMNPVVWAMAPNKLDWVRQKEKIQKILDNKIEQIDKFKAKFAPVDEPVNGTDWASNASVNPQGGKIYSDTTLELNDQFQKQSGKKWTNAPDLDIRKLRDKKNFSQDFSYEEDEGEKGRQTMRNVQCFTSSMGTTYIIDSTDGEETVYKIHKNFMQVIDQNGSRKVFIGRNQDNLDEKVGDDTKPPKNKDIRCNDELCVDGDKKTHVLGNINEYAKGMKSIQVDKCAEVDINESLGVVIRKGDLDIVVQGLEGRTGREDNSTHDKENEKASDWSGEKQRGNVNIDIQKGDIELHLGRNWNTHVDGDVNLFVDGNIRTTVKKDYHLRVGGNYYEHVKGEKYSKVVKHSEVDIGKHLSEKIGSDRQVTIGGNEVKNITGSMNIKIGGQLGFDTSGSATFKQSAMSVASNLNVSMSGMFGMGVNAMAILAGGSLSVAGSEMAQHMHTGNHGAPTPIIASGADSPQEPEIASLPTTKGIDAKGSEAEEAKRDTKRA